MRALPLTLAVASALLITNLLSAQTPSDAASRSSTSPASSLSVTSARLLAIIPGAGHFYADESGRGLKVIGSMVGLVLAASLLIIGDCLTDAFEGSGDRCENSSTSEDVTAAAVYGVWGWSIYDAGLAARRTNARRAPASLQVGLRHYPTGSGRQTRGLRMGLSLAIR